MKKKILAIPPASLAILLAGFFAFPPAAARDGAANAAADPLASLRKEHPRLLLSARDWAAFDTRVRERAADPQFDKLLAQLEKNARALLSKPPVERKLTGRRLLGVSREALRRVLTLAVVHRATGDDVFSLRAEKEMLAAAAFTDWNPSHFLDTAEMTAALALGYDWLHEKLSAETRATLRRAIVEKGLREGADPKLKHNSWHRSENNWNQVCFGGLSLGALAIAGDEPELARAMLAAARAGIARGLKPYAPDGVYPEGPGYWSYGTSYQVLLIAALESALGDDWGLSRSPGFMASASAQLFLTGPTGRQFNFSDCGSQRLFDPVLFWFAKKLGNPALAMPPGPSDSRGRFLPLAALWWPPGGLAPGQPPASALPLAWKGGGVNPVAVFRDSWTDPNAMYLAVKAGAASANHGHMDAGSFILEADGVRWALDLGMQDYESLESKGIKLWGRAQDSQRWGVFRLNNFSHNTLTIDGRLHRVGGRAELVKFWDEKDAGADGDLGAGARMDLSPVFAGQASAVSRAFLFRKKTRSIRIDDQIAGAKPGAEVRWAMVTKAQIRIHEDGVRAELSQAGKTLVAEIHPGAQPGGAPRFEVIPAEAAVKNDYDAPNPGARILIVRAKVPEDGRLAISVELHPAAAK